METRSSREERRAKKKKEKKTAVHSTRRAFTRVFEEERGGWRWRKWRPEEVRERGPFVEMPSVPLFAEAGEASLEHRIIAAVPARIPERKGSSWFSPGAVYRLPEKKTAAFTGNRRNFKSKSSYLLGKPSILAVRCSPGGRKMRRSSNRIR